MSKQKIFSVFLLTVLAGCTGRNSNLADVEFDNPPSLYHIVNKGDTVSSIAQQHNIDPDSIIRLNNLKSPYRIIPGQIITLDTKDLSGATSVVEDGTFSDMSNKNVLGEDVEVLEVASEEQDGKGQDVMASEEAITLEPEAVEEATIEEKPVALNGVSLSWPVRGRILKKFSPNGSPKNDGINIAAPKGTPVRASAGGTVKRIGNLIKDFGNVVLIDHGKNVITVYAHLNEVLVKEGQKVAQGQKIATVGKTGNVKQTQLHFEVREGTNPLNPLANLS